MARKVHGNRRSSHGFLLTHRHYLHEDQEWRIGQGYLGMLALFALPILFAYVQTMHFHTGYWSGSRHHLGYWSDLPADLKIAIPLVFVAHLTGMLSAARTILLWQGVGTREELGE
jgi:hypothetical protein